jgi:predicted HTH transcriptional regulator
VLVEGIPFDQTSVRNIIVQLCTQDAGIVESEYLEIKGWCHDERQLAEKVSEAAACIANASGGWVLVGIDEDDTKGSKFSQCPHPCMTVEWLVQRIHDLTMPPVENSVSDISDLVQDITGIQQANVLLVSVPKSKRMSGHVTIKGISKIRNGKECRPYYSIEDDRTKAPIQSLTISDLSSDSIKWAIERHASKFSTPQNYWEGQGAFLAHLGLIEIFSPFNTPDMSYRVLLAALLLFGKQATLNRYANMFETVVITEKGTTRFHRNVVESYRELCLTKNSLLPSLCPKNLA